MNVSPARRNGKDVCARKLGGNLVAKGVNTVPPANGDQNALNHWQELPDAVPARAVSSLVEQFSIGCNACSAAESRSVRMRFMQATQPDPRIEKAVRLLNEDSSRTLTDLASDCILSISRLSHLFKAKTGHTLGNFRRNCRFHAATKMLATTDMSIKQIAYALGYHHTSSFVRAFELHVGVSPSDYRDYGVRGPRAEVAADKDQATLSTTKAGFERTPA